MAFLDVAVLPLRAVQVIFSIIVLGLTAYVINAFDNPYGYDWSPDSVDFMLFCSIWTLLAVAYLVITPSRFPNLAHKYAILGVEVVTLIFWFAAWVAVATLLGDWHCGSHGGICGAGTAATVFSAFIWLTFVATTIVAALHVRRTARNDTAPPPQMQGV